MVLLHRLQSQKNLQLIVAHFNHGIRPEAAADELLVKSTAKAWNLPFEVGYGHLGPNASEAAARRARYRFLEKIRKLHDADFIVTAHHQDDELETAILNLLRGSGRRGLSAMRNNIRLKRPLLDTPKAAIVAYARKHGLVWHEDPTNADTRLLRNYVRRHIMPHFYPGQAARSNLLKLIDRAHQTGQAIDAELAQLTAAHPHVLDRDFFRVLPHAVAKEMLMHWLRRNGIRQFNKETVERLSVAAKTARAGSRHNIGGYWLVVDKATIGLQKTP